MPLCCCCCFVLQTIRGRPYFFLLVLLHENILVVTVLVLVDERVRLLENDLIPVGVGLLKPEEQLLGRGLELQHQDTTSGALGDGDELCISWEQDQILCEYRGRGEGEQGQCLPIFFFLPSSHVGSKKKNSLPWRFFLHRRHCWYPGSSSRNASSRPLRPCRPI